MELVALWIKNYKNIKNQCFNFSPLYKFAFQKKDEKIYINKTQYKRKFRYFDQSILNLTAIIGQNGSGKSSILEIIKRNEESIIDEIILIFKENDQFYYLNHRFIQIFLEPSCLNLKKITKIKNLDIMKISNVFQIGCEQKKLRNLDLDISQEILNTDDIEELRIQQVYRVAKLIKSRKFKNNKLIKIPKTVAITIDLSRNYMLSEDLEDYFDGEIDLLMEAFFSSYFDRYLADIQLNKIIKFLPKKTKKMTSLEFFLKFLNKIELKNTFEEKSKYLRADFCLEYGLFERLKKLLITFYNFLNEMIKETDVICYYGTYGYITVPVDRLTNIIEIAYEHYRGGKLENRKNIFQFHWGETLSSGEEMMLEFFAKINSQKLKINSKNILLLLDEPDITLHPEWQRNFLTFFLELLRIIFENKNFQIILTSHSPFILSDLPKKNVILLKTYTKEDSLVLNKSQELGNCEVLDSSCIINTLGTNIHTLLADGFFLKSTIGAYAQLKITKIIRILNILEKIKEKPNKSITKNKIIKNKEEIINFIEEIGEPLLKNKLKSMCNCSFNQEIKNKKEINQIENIFKLLSLEQKKQVIETLKEKL